MVQSSGIRNGPNHRLRSKQTLQQVVDVAVLRLLLGVHDTAAHLFLVALAQDILRFSSNHVATTHAHDVVGAFLNGSTDTCQVQDPSRNAANTEPLTELVTEMAAIVRQDVVLRDRPLLLEKGYELQDLNLRGRCIAHRQGLAIGVAVAIARSAAEDARGAGAPGGRASDITEAPLPIVDLHAAMKSTSAKRRQQPIQRCAPARRSYIVDVQVHRHGPGHLLAWHVMRSAAFCAHLAPQSCTHRPQKSA